MSDKECGLLKRTHRHIETKEGKVYDEELEYFEEERYHIVYTKGWFRDERIALNTIVEDYSYVSQVRVFFRFFLPPILLITLITLITYFIIDYFQLTDLFFEILELSNKWGRSRFNF